VIPRGRALGLTHFVPEDDRHTMSREYLIDSMTAMMGGRAAEEIVFNRITTGAAHDIQNATALTRKMVCEWGMSENLGPIQFGKKEELIFLGREISQQKDYSEKTAEAIDAEVHSMVSQAYRRATELIKTHENELHRLAAALLEREVLDAEEIALVVAGKELKIQTVSRRAERMAGASPAGDKSVDSDEAQSADSPEARAASKRTLSPDASAEAAKDRPSAI
jgi:cell division protease FtsH